MKAALKTFSQERLHRIFAPLADTPKIAIALSGGGDSMALLRLVLRWRATPVSLVALTVDHALREESKREARQVKAWCKAMGVRHVTLKWNHEALSSGLQARARTARYDLMTAWCKRRGVKSLLTGHTKDDQAETVAMRQRRTDSAKSLAGIWPENDWNGMRLVRPLLGVSRKALRDYLEAIDQPWLEDPSNQNLQFERARQRAEGQSLSLANTANKAQRWVRAAQAGAASWVSNHVVISPDGMLAWSGQSLHDLNELTKMEALLRLLALAGGQSTELEKRHRILQWLEKGGNGRRTLGGTIFVKRGASFIAAREPGRVDHLPVTLFAGKTVIWDNRFKVSAPSRAIVLPKCAVQGLKRRGEIPAFVDQGLPVVSLAGVVLAEGSLIHDRCVKITVAAKK